MLDVVYTIWQFTFLTCAIGCACLIISLLIWLCINKGVI